MLPIHDNVWVVDQPLRFLGVELGTRMSVIRFGEDLLLHSPIAPTDELRQELEQLGHVRWVVGPNMFHHLYLEPWMELGAQGWAVPGLVKKRPDLSFDGLLTSSFPWSTDLDVMVLESLPLMNEAVFFHQPSKTLIVSDLLFNISPSAPLLTRSAMRLAGAYPGPSASILERAAMKRDIAREELRRLLELPLEKIVLAHGDIIQTEPLEKLHSAYKWLEL